MTNARLDELTDYPFQRLRNLLDGTEGGGPMLNFALGEPQMGPPTLLTEGLASDTAGWGKYPPANSTPELRGAIADWLDRRYGLTGDAAMDPESEIMPLNGTREGLFQIANLVVPAVRAATRPLVLVPNPFYQCYMGAAVMAGAEVGLMPAIADNGFLPDLEALDRETLHRAVLMYVCTPANPQGSMADEAYLEKALEIARANNIVLALDECYAEIYDETPPPGGLQIAAATPERFANLVVFHSLSKRSSAPGLRSGFMAGDRDLVARFGKLRSFGGAPLPNPVAAASTALWRDEAHVEGIRAHYRRLFDIADETLGNRRGYFRPAGGFFLWLDVGDGEAFAKKLWEASGVRVLPGGYLARDEAAGNPGQPFVRVALVHDEATVRKALTAIAALME
ncbi:MAG: aminotransferase class I/II-fold pyridoxal phosphate-dependent enzyme [Minwuia sp.]|uniref:aminotransferase class I/II-fold pyridoxal phosphate-dependent enzyme n=1 Tax=Minwuia sp. TaxID=2493630 RepID=UPI003A87A5D9